MINERMLTSEGFCRGVYSLMFPEVMQVLRDLNEDFPYDKYEASWKQGQLGEENSYLSLFEEWGRKAISLDWDSFPFRYFSHGSIEAIRESISTHAIQRPGVPIHVFDGEYEGYAAIAKECNIDVIVHSRANWKESLAVTGGRSPVWYISEPSSIDGNYWTELNAFLEALEETDPNARVKLDLAYIGIAKRKREDVFPGAVRTSIVDTLFLSLSKSFGVYYFRIGAAFYKEPSRLEANKYFKNLFSIEFGRKLMARYWPGMLAKRYEHLQVEAIDRAGKCGASWLPSEVLLLAYSDVPSEVFARAQGQRACLTPYLDKALNT